MIFNKAYCINLLKRPEKKILAQEQFDKIGLSVEFIEAVDGTDLPTNEYGLIGGYQGLNQTIINILNDAIENNYSGIRIIEDDIVFDDDFNSIFIENAQYIPENFSVLYFGCKSHLYSTPNIGGRIHYVHSAHLGHDFIIKKEMFEPLKAELAKMEAPSDVCLRYIYTKTLGESGEHTFKACCFKRGISSQREGYSDNMKKVTRIEVD